MKAKCNLQTSVDPGSVLQRVPARFRKCIDTTLLGEQPCDLVVFPPESRYVVSSKDLLAGIERLPSSRGKLVAIGYDFTQEARDLIAEADGLAFALDSSFGWTDDSWLSIHASGAA